jgi:ribonucleoside-diphosphate reductase alpha chain
MSQELAEEIGEFKHYPANKECMNEVIHRHKSLADLSAQNFAVSNSVSTPSTFPPIRNVMNIWDTSVDTWQQLKGPYRNAQTTLLAPCGTISFMMDSNTTSIEPETGLIKYKKLIGGGTLKLVNPSIEHALRKLKKSEFVITKIVEHIESAGTIEGTSLLTEEELEIFDCAYKAPGGKRFISVNGHLEMMAAVQPFLSGAISKTVSLPNEATVQDIEKCIFQAWTLGLKSIAIYRDGSKAVEPLTNKKDNKIECIEIKEVTKPIRRRLPDERKSITHKFNISGYEGYLTVGLFDDGSPGELFVRMAKTGSMVNGLMDSFALSTSLSLQYGVPLNVLIDKYTHTRFEPSGFTSNREIPIAKSIVDYIFRWLDLKFNNHNREVSEITQIIETVSEIIPNECSDAPACHECGSWMTRSGTCYRCPNCGATSGCS